MPVGGSFTVTLSFKRSKKKGGTFVKVTRTDFYIDGKRKKSKHTLKARVYIKVKKGKSPKKSISTSFSVC